MLVKKWFCSCLGVKSGIVCPQRCYLVSCIRISHLFMKHTKGLIRFWSCRRWNLKHDHIRFYSSLFRINKMSRELLKTSQPKSKSNPNFERLFDSIRYLQFTIEPYIISPQWRTPCEKIIIFNNCTAHFYYTDTLKQNHVFQYHITTVSFLHIHAVINQSPYFTTHLCRCSDEVTYHKSI